MGGGEWREPGPGRPLASAVFDDALLRRHRPEFGESSLSVEQMLATAWARTCTQRTQA